MSPQSLKREDCVEKIVEKYSDTVYKLAFAQMRKKEDADDVFQEVFLHYIKSAPEFESIEHEKAWFIRVTLNCCKDIWRKENRRNEVALEEASEVAAPTKSDLLESSLSKLDEHDRILIHLYYYEGYRCGEIAKMLEKNPAAVRMQLSRARKALKKYIEEEDFDA